MAEVARARVRGPLADELASWVSVTLDLEFIMNIIEELSRRPDPRPHSIVDMDVVSVGLWNAAQVAYSRCFLTGRRYAAGAILRATMTPEEHAIHGRILDRRMQHVAHLSHSAPFERMDVYVAIDPNDGQTAVLYDGDKLSLPRVPLRQAFTRLVDRLMIQARTRRDAAFAAVEAAFNQRPPSERARIIASGTFRPPSPVG